MAVAKTPDSKLDFEASFRKLEETVQTLERGGLTLDQATKLYEQGMQLAKVCAKRLDGAELKVRELQAAFQESAVSPEEEE